MDSKTFLQYKNHFLPAIVKVLKTSQKGSLDEAAFPAYSHPNPFISYLFWKRLHIIITYLENHHPYESILDFGTGSGVMLPFLGSVAKNVEALDVDVTPAKRIGSIIPFPPNITLTEYTEDQSGVYHKESFDLIVALDVLEHLQNLQKATKWLFSLLKPGGQIIFSGPSENILYKIGRRIAGKDFTGNYHTSNINDVKDEVEKITRVKIIAQLYPFLNFFRIYSVVK